MSPLNHIQLPDWLVFFVKQIAGSKSVLLLVSLLTIAITAASAISPLYIGRMIDEVMQGHGETILRDAIVLASVFLIIELFTTIRSYVSMQAMQRLTNRLTLQTMKSVFHTSSDFFTKTSRGELLQRCIQDTRMIQQFGLFTLPTLIQATLLGCTAIIVIGRIYWPVAIMIVLAYIVLFIPVHVFGKKRGDVRQKLIHHNAVIRQSLLEKLESHKQIRIFGTERKEFEQFAREQEQWAKLSFQENILTDAFKGFPRIPDSLAPAIVFLFIGWQVAAGQATIGELMTVIAFIPAINAPVRLFFMQYVTIADIRIRLRGIIVYSRLPQEPGRTIGLWQPLHIRNMPITFRHVAVAGDRGTLLQDVTFTVTPGEHVAIVGPTGAGKSTLLKLLVRLIEPSAGSIQLGDANLSDLDAAYLRRRIGYVTQEGYLFNDSLQNNLTYLQPEADPALIEYWMHAFGAEDIARKLPDGYATVLGDKGAVLSGGQRQLIGLIRTMLKQPDLLLLDEVTASLDPASEAVVNDALDVHARAEGITRISVTHRLQAAMNADRILVVAEGTLVEEGTHEQLLRRPGGVYARLWNSQQHQQANPYRTMESLKEGERDSALV